MFTGLIADLGTVAGLDRSEAGARLEVRTSLAEGLEAGDSVAVNGVCLTAIDPHPGGFSADVMNQTLGLTSLGGLGTGSRVNLEPALRAGDPMGGHVVQGHVDGRAEVVAVVPDGIARRLRLRLDPGLRRYVVAHGSIALDGISLTVAALTGDGLEVSLIPETLERTTLGAAKEGDRVNVEVDVMARYAERLLEAWKTGGERSDDEDV